MISISKHHVTFVIDQLKIDEEDPYEQAKKAVQQIHDIDAIDKPFDLDTHEPFFIDITYISRGKKYKKDFSFYNLYTKICEEYPKLEKSNPNESYTTSNLHVKKILYNFFDVYCDKYGKLYNFDLTKTSIFDAITNLMKGIDDEYKKLEQLESRYAKIELFDRVCEILLIVVVLNKFGSMERIVAEITVFESDKLYNYVILTEVLFAYILSDLREIDIQKLYDKTPKLLNKVMYNTYINTTSTVLNTLQFEAYRILSEEKIIHDKIIELNQMNHKSIESYLINRDKGIDKK